MYHISQWDWGQTGIKLETKHVMYQKLVNDMDKKDIYVNRLETVPLASKCIFYRPEHNAKGVRYRI